MLLTTDQLTSLRVDLQSLAGIKYDPVLAELLDHYATLTEQHMDTGLSFIDASKWAWNDLGQGEGIQQIQNDYIANVQQQIRSRHLAIVKSYFRWPAFLTTALMGMLVYLVVPLLPADITHYVVLAVAFIPSFIMVWLERKLKHEPTSQRFLLFEYIANHNKQHVNALVISLNFWLILTDDRHSRFLQAQSTFTIIVCMLLLLYAISFMQLLNERFDLRTKIV